VDVLEIRKRFGNGTTTVYRRALNNDCSPIRRALTAEERDEENERLRIVKSRANALQRALSSSLNYAITFTTSNIDLAKNGVLFLKTVANYLKKQNITFYIELENFNDFENKGFHIHGLTDKRIDFNEWIEKYGSNVDDDIEEEHFNIKIENLHNLYCEEIYSSQYKWVRYIIKKIFYTKKILERLFPNKRCRVYLSNVKKINVDSDICVKDINDIIDDDDFDIWKVDDGFNNKKVVEIKEKYQSYYKLNVAELLCNDGNYKKSVLKVERQVHNTSNTERYVLSISCKALYINTLQSNTGQYGCPISLEKIEFFCFNVKLFLLKYLGYVRNIPEKIKN